MNKLLIAAAAPAGLALVLAGCSSSDSANSASPEPSSTSASATSATPTTVSPTATTTTSTGTPTSSPTEALCSKAEIEAQLPEGSTVERYACAATGTGSGSEYWAAAEVSQGPTVFFLQANDARTKWTQVSLKKEICGTASAGLPPEILAFC